MKPRSTTRQQRPRLAYSASAAASALPGLRRRLARAMPLLRTRLEEVSIAVVGDARMSRLHRQFMGVDGPTDVITFELDHDAHGRPTSGQVVICAGEARRQARRMRTSRDQELLLYALHGLLHLSGFDDRTPREYDRMHAMEDRVLRRIGVGPVFRPRPGKETS